MKRLWEGWEKLQKMNAADFPAKGNDEALDEKVKKYLHELDEFMNDDFSTAKVLANLF